MHEIGLAQDILNSALQSAQTAHAHTIKKLLLKVGTFSGVVPESLTFGLEMLSKNTIAEGAQIQIILIPLVIECSQCHQQSFAKPPQLTCPFCRKSQVKKISGEELELASIDIE